MKKMVDRARELLELAEEFKLEEIQLEVDGLSFRANRTPGSSPSVASTAPPAPLTPGHAPAESHLHESAESAPAPAKSDEKLVPVASPMVGVFYLAAAPEKPPYVRVGDTVEPDTTVCIVEAMKLMNEIKAGVRGRVTRCLVDNQTPVKAGQTLFLVEPV